MEKITVYKIVSNSYNEGNIKGIGKWLVETVKQAGGDMSDGYAISTRVNSIHCRKNHERVPGICVMVEAQAHPGDMSKLKSIPYIASALVNDPLSIVGDPHVKNLAGEKFDITQSGTHICLHIPRGAEGGDLQLQLQTNVVQLDGECNGLFATQVMMTGYMLGSAKKIVFDATQKFSVTVGHVTTNHKLDQLWTLVHGQVPPQGWPAREPFDTTMLASTDFNGRPMFAISLGTVSIKVERARHKTFSFLNLDVKGVSELKLPIGGLLGFDSHQHASKVPTHCASRQAKLYQVRASSDDYFMRVS